MARTTGIQWAVATWDPWRGCTKVSPGCANCYAETLANRNPAVFGSWGKGAPRVLSKSWGEPLKWNREVEKLGLDPLRVFPSKCDWLDDEVPHEWRSRFLQLIHDTPHLNWLLLTKRPENFEYLLKKAFSITLNRPDLQGAYQIVHAWWGQQRPPANVWLGVSVEDQKRADERMRQLRDIPARLKFLSVEPLLTGILVPTHIFRPDWVIVGGESSVHGRDHARVCHLDWIRMVVQICKVDHIPCFVKQIGSNPIAKEFDLWTMHGCPDDWKPVTGSVPMKITHPKGGDPAEWPEFLRVREFPKGYTCTV